MSDQNGNSVDDTMGQEPSHELEPIGQGQPSAKYVNSVGRELNQIFASRPLLGSAWAAQLEEHFRSFSSWHDLHESLTRIQKSLAVPRFTMPPGIMDGLQEAIAASVDLGNFRKMLSEQLASLSLSLTRAADFRNPDPHGIFLCDDLP